MPSLEPTYTLSIVSKALNIPLGPLATWARRGWMANFEAAFKQRVRGRAQQLSKADALASALIKVASEVGVTQPPEIISYAPMAARDYLDHPEEIRQLIIGWNTELSACSIRYNDDVMKEPARNEAEVTVTSSLYRI